jgi:hypothetical protein
VRLARLATPIAMLCLVLAGCGGGANVAVEDAPGGTSGLRIPGGDNLAPQATATATPTVTASATATTTSSTPATTTAPSATATAVPTQTAPQGTTGGGTAAPASQATPPPGADTQKFEAFCQQNPGAC